MKQQSNHLLLLIFLMVVALPVIFADDKCINDNEQCSIICRLKGYISYGAYNARGCRAPVDKCSFDNDDNDLCSKCSLREFSKVSDQYQYIRRCIRCSEPDSCADADSPANTKACILIGMKKKEGTIGSCEWPTASDCVAAGKSNCSSAISSISCKNLGFLKSDTGTDDCVYPNCLSLSSSCGGYWKPCRQLGYIPNYKYNCMKPRDCTVGDQCQTPKIACIEAGFTKHSGDNDNCVCQGPFKALIESELDLVTRVIKLKNQCVDCKSDSNACSNACIALGWVTSAGHKCVEPSDSDCLAQPNACDSKKVCVVVKGFVARSNTDKGCMAAVPGKV